MRAAWVVGIGLVAACGDNLVDDGWNVRSGSRLRVVQLETDGARARLGLHDRARDERCSFQLGPGQTVARCLPALAGVAGFLDAGCTRPLVARSRPSCGPPPRYARLPYGGCGGGVARIWELAPAPIAVTAVYGRDADGACTLRSPSPDYDWYPATDELLLAAFVGAEVRVAAGPERVRDRYLAGEDGSRWELGSFDAELGVPCYLGADYGVTTCAPDALEGGWYWTDATCTTPLVERDSGHPACAGAPPPYAAVWTRPTGGAECWSRQVFALGAPTPAADLHFGIGTCQARDPAELELYAIGAPIDGVATGERALVGTGRIRTHVVRTGASTRASGNFHDVDLGTDCTPGPALDGTIRCLPAGAWIGTYFADAQCTRDQLVGETIADCTGAMPIVVAASESVPATDTCDEGSYRVRRLGAELVSGTLYRRGDDDTSCVAFTWDRARQRVYALGDELPPAQLARFVETID